MINYASFLENFLSFFKESNTLNFSQPYKAHILCLNTWIHEPHFKLGVFVKTSDVCMISNKCSQLVACILRLFTPNEQFWFSTYASKVSLECALCKPLVDKLIIFLSLKDGATLKNFVKWFKFIHIKIVLLRCCIDSYLS